mmetsp:Transcript_23490/g.67997  ORF Transcript_23490/g.67997 Transcript_23490/m.67997 type:complete len:240 (-) Transcript_23490:947-1666(-)
MLLHLTSPWTIVGSMVCKYISALLTSSRTLVSGTSGFAHFGIAWTWCTNSDMPRPSTNSKISASSPLSGSIAEPWKATMWLWRTLRRSLISLQSEAMSCALFRAAPARGALMATGAPRSRPMATQPKPPAPQSTGGCRTCSSEVPTSQCSRTPISAMCSRAARMDACKRSGAQRPQSRSMSWKTRSVLSEVAVLASSAWDMRQSGTPASPASSSIVSRASGTQATSLGECSTWLTPSTN